MDPRSTQNSDTPGEPAAIFVALELHPSKWGITSLSPGTGGKTRKHRVNVGDWPWLISQLSSLIRKTRVRTGRDYPVIAIYATAIGAFWAHRRLTKEGIESHVVDVSWRPALCQRAKRDRLDGETLITHLMAYKRGEPGVRMLYVPSEEESDAGTIFRHGRDLIKDRARYVKWITELLSEQGISHYEPLREDRRSRLDELRTSNGRALSELNKEIVGTYLSLLEMGLTHSREVEVRRDKMLAEQPADAAVTRLLRIRGVSAEFAVFLWSRGMLRQCGNRRQLAAYAGLAPTPRRGGAVDGRQGVSKSSNPGLRAMFIRFAWLWLRHQPDSALSQWFKARLESNNGRGKKAAIVALARKLLVAIWKYVNCGVAIEGVVFKTA